MRNAEEISGRSFKLWDYSPSLSRLLIRSPRRNEEDYNVDVIFYGVVRLEINDLIGEMSIDSENSSNPTYQRFMLRTEKCSHIIEAVSYIIELSYTDIFDSPLDSL